MTKLKLFTFQWQLALLVFILTCILQLQNYFLHYTQNSIPNLDTLKKTFFIATENILLSLLLMLVFAFVNLFKTYKGVSISIFYSLLLYLIFNQVFYSIYATEYRIGFDKEAEKFSLHLLKDSFLSLLNFWFYLNIGLALICAYLGTKSLAQNSLVKPRKKTAILTTLAMLSIIVFGFVKSQNYKNAFFVLAKSCFEKEATVYQKNDIPFNKLFSLINGKSTTKDYEIDKYAQDNKPDKPNIIYIVLESVGALNIMNNNQLDSLLTPNLYKLKNKSILFPKIYNYFPATTRSHVPILCGGNSITYGSVYEELNYKYLGNTMVSEFKNNTYKTALFSSQFMEFEGLDSFYLNLPFDFHYMPESNNNARKSAAKLNSWGIDEAETLTQIKTWISAQASTPFFLELMNSGTHHPYSVPNNYKGPYPNTTQLNKYKNAIHYSDHMIGLLVQYLKENQLYEKTVICISGDHDESFGDKHSNNLLHNNYVYEENIKNFLLILDPNQKSGKQIVSNKNGSIGDIMPTIVSFTKGKNTEIIGQNLFDKNYQSKIHYFYKHSYPKKWGLIDGNWKYIEEITEGQNPELYNLETDPFEQNNLASEYPHFITTYTKLIPSWYVQLNKIYRSKLLSFSTNSATELNEKDLRSEGPTNIAFGNINKKDNFEKKLIFNPNEQIFVYLKLNPYPFETRLKCIWKSPSGAKFENDFYLDKIWSNAWQPFERNKLLEEGIWECSLFKDDKVVIKGNFEISTKAKLNYPYQYKEGPIKLQFGIKDDAGFTALQELHPQESIVAFSQINPYTKNTVLNYVWISPSGKNHNYFVPCNKDWNYTWLLLNEGEPMEEGKWKMNIYDGKNKLIETTFRVNHQAKLYQPFLEDL